MDIPARLVHAPRHSLPRAELYRNRTLIFVLEEDLPFLWYEHLGADCTLLELGRYRTHPHPQPSSSASSQRCPLVHSPSLGITKTLQLHLLHCAPVSKANVANNSKNERDIVRVHQPCVGVMRDGNRATIQGSGSWPHNVRSSRSFLRHSNVWTYHI